MVPTRPQDEEREPPWYFYKPVDSPMMIDWLLQCRDAISSIRYLPSDCLDCLDYLLWSCQLSTQHLFRLLALYILQQLTNPRPPSSPLLTPLHLLKHAR